MGIAWAPRGHRVGTMFGAEETEDAAGEAASRKRRSVTASSGSYSRSRNGSGSGSGGSGSRRRGPRRQTPRAKLKTRSALDLSGGDPQGQGTTAQPSEDSVVVMAPPPPQPPTRKRSPMDSKMFVSNSLKASEGDVDGGDKDAGPSMLDNVVGDDAIVPPLGHLDLFAMGGGGGGEDTDTQQLLAAEAEAKASADPAAAAAAAAAANPRAPGWTRREQFSVVMHPRAWSEFVTAPDSTGVPDAVRSWLAQKLRSVKDDAERAERLEIARAQFASGGGAKKKPRKAAGSGSGWARLDGCLLLVGPTGVGKTALLQLLAADMGLRLVDVLVPMDTEGRDLLTFDADTGKDVGRTSRVTRKLAALMTGVRFSRRPDGVGDTVLVLDNIDTLTRKDVTIVMDKVAPKEAPRSGTKRPPLIVTATLPLPAWLKDVLGTGKKLTTETPQGDERFSGARRLYMDPVGIGGAMAVAGRLLRAWLADRAYLEAQEAAREGDARLGAHARLVAAASQCAVGTEIAALVNGGAGVDRGGAALPGNPAAYGDLRLMLTRLQMLLSCFTGDPLEVARGNVRALFAGSASGAAAQDALIRASTVDSDHSMWTAVKDIVVPTMDPLDLARLASAKTAGGADAAAITPEEADRRDAERLAFDMDGGTVATVLFHSALLCAPALQEAARGVAARGEAFSEPFLAAVDSIAELDSELALPHIAQRGASAAFSIESNAKARVAAHLRRLGRAAFGRAADARTAKWTRVGWSAGAMRSGDAPQDAAAAAGRALRDAASGHGVLKTGVGKRDLFRAARSCKSSVADVFHPESVHTLDMSTWATADDSELAPWQAEVRGALEDVAIGRMGTDQHLARRIKSARNLGAAEAELAEFVSAHGPHARGVGPLRARVAALQKAQAGPFAT